MTAFSVADVFFWQSVVALLGFSVAYVAVPDTMPQTRRLTVAGVILAFGSCALWWAAT